MEAWRKENNTIYVCTAATVVGLWAMGAGPLSFFGFAFFLFVNIPRRRSE